MVPRLSWLQEAELNYVKHFLNVVTVGSHIAKEMNFEEA